MVDELRLEDKLAPYLQVALGIMRCGRKPLCGDPNFISEIIYLIHWCRCDLIIETGTLFGHSTEFFGRVFPSKPVFTCEIETKFFNDSQIILRTLDNVEGSNETSPEFLKRFKDLDQVTPFLFLDAHNAPWTEKGQCALLKELEILITQPKMVICIHDFKVPFESKFGYDNYPIGELSEELIKPVVDKIPDYCAYYPIVSAIENVADLRGRIYLVVGMDPFTMEGIDSNKELLYRRGRL